MASDSYLVTGGAGFIGSNLARRLLDEGHAVRVLDDFSTGRRENLEGISADLDMLEGTITSPATCEKAVHGVDYVLHQAALPSVARSVADPVATHEVNATGTLNVLIAARDAGVRRVVLAGSSSAYGDTPELPKHEAMPPRPRSPYAVSKLATEQYAAAFAAVYDLETVTLRYFNVFGPRQDPASQYSAVIPLFIRHALLEEPPIINGDGGQTRDFTYIDNVVEANLAACTAPAEKASGRVFNVGCGDRISVNELWERIREITGASVEAEHGAARPGDVRDSLADLTAVRECLGYRGDVGLAEGLRRTVEWFEPILAPER